MPRKLSEDQTHKQMSLQEEFAVVVARVESLRSRQAESERQVNGLFESLLAESFA